MMVENSREELGRAECLALLSRATLGRIGVSAGALPHVEPVHFRLVGDEVLMRVGRRSRLDIAATDNVVAFEVDAFDAVSRTGWSIVVTGVARRVDEPEAIEALASLAVPQWATDNGECVLAISTDVISGERVHPPDFEQAGHRADRLGTAEVLGVDECWSLLAAENVGRLAVIRGDTPLVTPINYAVDGRTIVFRTDPGTKFHQGPRSKVAFEIDGLDHAAQHGWSVVAVGFLNEVTPDEAAALARAQQLAVQPWAGGKKRHVMRLTPSSVTGRRVGRLAGSALAATCA
jgi:nitroimidazol reductase NimA-like FMN-containing flavoprotein (pyridoxamine 5'-phosphate oxidase superfamily)